MCSHSPSSVLLTRPTFPLENNPPAKSPVNPLKLAVVIFITIVIEINSNVTKHALFEETDKTSGKELRLNFLLVKSTTFTFPSFLLDVWTKATHHCEKLLDLLDGPLEFQLGAVLAVLHLIRIIIIMVMIKLMIMMMMALYRDQHMQLVVQVLPVWLPSVLLLLQVQQRSASVCYA